MKPRDRGSLEYSLSRVLAAGVLLALVLLTVGTVLMFVRGSAAVEGDPLDYPNALYTLDFHRTVTGAFSGDVVSLLELGLLVLVLTPMARVVAAGLLFARSREWVFVGVATVILSILAAGWLGL